MKAIMNIQPLILVGILFIANQLVGQTLLPVGPIVRETPCEDEKAFEAKYTLSATPDTFVLNNFSILGYQWIGPADTQPGSGNTYDATETGAYILIANALRLSDSVRVEFKDTVEVIFDAQCCKAQVPNAFTPNGDNKNDLFAPVLPNHCVFQDYQLQVYNRWGQKVFDTNLMNAPLTSSTVLGWDGKINGNDAPSDVYVYWLRYTSTGNNNTYTYSTKGDVTLIR